LSKNIGKNIQNNTRELAQIVSNLTGIPIDDVGNKMYLQSPVYRNSYNNIFSSNAGRFGDETMYIITNIKTYDWVIVIDKGIDVESITTKYYSNLNLEEAKSISSIIR